MGRETIRGVNVDHWQTCMYWPLEAANFTLDYYFSGKILIHFCWSFKRVNNFQNKTKKNPVGTILISNINITERRNNETTNTQPKSK